MLHAAIEEAKQRRSPCRKTSFRSHDGLDIAYYDWNQEAAGPPVVLHHGFAVNTRLNWVRPKVVQQLVGSGKRVVALDARGHGRSAQPLDPSYYGEGNMARDVITLLDIIGAKEVDLVGYSMGGVVALLVAAQDSRVRRLVAAGVGEGIIHCGGVDSRVLHPAVLRAALRNELSGLTNHKALMMRLLVAVAGSNREALAAHCSSVHAKPIALHTIGARSLVIAGSRDPLAAHPERLAAAIPDAALVVVPGSHETAVGKREFADALLGFLA